MAPIFDIHNYTKTSQKSALWLLHIVHILLCLTFENFTCIIGLVQVVAATDAEHSGLADAIL